MSAITDFYEALDWQSYGAGFSGVAAELRYEMIGRSTYVEADMDGDGAADFRLELSGRLALTEGDFNLGGSL